MLENHNPITKWYKLQVNNEGMVTAKSFNHYSNGWVEGEYPLPFNPNFSNQVAWSKDKWVKEFTYIEKDMIII